MFATIGRMFTTGLALRSLPAATPVGKRSRLVGYVSGSPYAELPPIAAFWMASIFPAIAREPAFPIHISDNGRVRHRGGQTLMHLAPFDFTFCL